MCLQSTPYHGHLLDGLRKQDWVVGWKIVSRDNGSHCPLFYDINRPLCLGVNVADYGPGFHCFFTRKAAREYRAMKTDKVIRVRVRGKDIEQVGLVGPDPAPLGFSARKMIVDSFRSQ